MTEPAPLHVHATAVSVAEWGVLIEGPSGSGKSALAAMLLADAAARQWCGRLIGDDRLALTAVNGRLVVRTHPAIAGLLEHRGQGLLRLPIEPAAVVRLIVRLVLSKNQVGERLPGEAPVDTMAGVTLPLLRLLAGDGARDNAARVMALLPRLSGTFLETVQSAC